MDDSFFNWETFERNYKGRSREELINIFMNFWGKEDESNKTFIQECSIHQICQALNIFLGTEFGQKVSLCEIGFVEYLKGNDGYILITVTNTIREDRYRCKCC